jgi:hypothetical protein
MLSRALRAARAWCAGLALYLLTRLALSRAEPRCAA